MAAPRLLGGIGAGDLPARHAGDVVEVERRRRPQDVEAHEAMLRVGLPGPVVRQGGEIAQPFLDLSLRRDVGAAAAIAAEDAVLEDRTAADADPAQRAVGVLHAVLEVAEFRAPRQHRQVILPVRLGQVGIRRFPARLADDAGARGIAVHGVLRELDEAMLRVGLPEPVGRDHRQIAQPRFGRGQRAHLAAVLQLVAAQPRQCAQPGDGSDLNRLARPAVHHAYDADIVALGRDDGRALASQRLRAPLTSGVPAYRGSRDRSLTSNGPGCSRTCSQMLAPRASSVIDSPRLALTQSRRASMKATIAIGAANMLAGPLSTTSSKTGSRAVSRMR